MLLPLIAEFFGTFIFLMSILATGNPIIAGATLSLLIYLLESISGGYINPAVSFAMFLKGAISTVEFTSYVAIQFAGAGCAYYAYRTFN
jgi:aquaporin Z